MKRRSSDNHHKLMIGINTWLFGVGAILIGYNSYKGLPLDGGDRVAIFANLTQAEALTVSSFAIMMSGFFYSLIILKPDMLTRNRERKLIALKADAVRHADYTDELTGLSNLTYFKLVLDSYLEETIALDKTLGVLVVQVNSKSSFHTDSMQCVADLLKSTARDYDVVAKIDMNKIAVLTPNIEARDLFAISNRYKSILMGTKSPSISYDCSIGFAANTKKTDTSSALLEIALNNLAVAQRLDVHQFAA